MNFNVICGTVTDDKISINKNELAQRLGTDRGFEHSVIDFCIEEFNKTVNYKYAYMRVPVNFVGKNTCNIGFGDIYSKNLCHVLKDCKHAIVLAVTTGIGVDRLLSRLSVNSLSKYFITDAIGSAAAESFCDYMDDMLRDNSVKPHRFSPGYGDLSLDIQPDLLNMLDAYKNLGIIINSSHLMTPAKTITAVMGVCNEYNN